MYFRWENPPKKSKEGVSSRKILERVIDTLKRTSQNNLEVKMLNRLSQNLASPSPSPLMQDLLFEAGHIQKIALQQTGKKRDQIFFGKVLGGAEPLPSLSFTDSEGEQIKGQLWKLMLGGHIYVLQKDGSAFRFYSKSNKRHMIAAYFDTMTLPFLHLALSTFCLCLDFMEITPTPQGFDVKREFHPFIEPLANYLQNSNFQNINIGGFFYELKKTLSLHIQLVSVEDIEKNDLSIQKQLRWTREDWSGSSFTKKEEKFLSSLADIFRETVWMTQVFNPQDYLTNSKESERGIIGYQGTPPKQLERAEKSVAPSAYDDLVNFYSDSSNWISFGGYTLLSLDIYGELAQNRKEMVVFWTGLGRPMTQKEQETVLPTDSTGKMNYPCGMLNLLRNTDSFFQRYRSEQGRLRFQPTTFRENFMVEIPPLSPLEVLEALIPFISEDPVRYYLQGILFDLETNWAIATDGHRMSAMPFDPSRGFENMGDYGPEIQELLRFSPKRLYLQVLRPQNVDASRRESFKKGLKGRKYVIIPFYANTKSSEMSIIQRIRSTELYDHIVAHYTLVHTPSYPDFNFIIPEDLRYESFSPEFSAFKKETARYKLDAVRLRDAVRNNELLNEIIRSSASNTQGHDGSLFFFTQKQLFLAPAVSLNHSEKDQVSSTLGQDIFGDPTFKAPYSSDIELQNDLFTSLISTQSISFSGENSVELIAFNSVYLKEALTLGAVGLKKSKTQQAIISYSNHFSPLYLFFPNGAICVIMPFRL